MKLFMPFTLVDIIDKEPHVFSVFRFNHLAEKQWILIQDDFIASQRLTAPAFQLVNETGFDGNKTKYRLNEYGLNLLPDLPDNPELIAKEPVITDLTEIIALHCLCKQCPGLRFPYPRVLHKEVIDGQHRGIDLLAYLENEGCFSLYVIEVMASAQNNHPPQTVRDHYVQLLTDTLNQEDSTRLLKELRILHSETSDNYDKNVLNGFIVLLLSGDFNFPQGVVAVPVLVRPFGLFHVDDWKPFLEKRQEFEDALISSRVWFIAVELLVTFQELYDYLRQSLRN